MKVIKEKLVNNQIMKVKMNNKAKKQILFKQIFS